MIELFEISVFLLHFVSKFRRISFQSFQFGETYEGRFNFVLWSNFSFFLFSGSIVVVSSGISKISLKCFTIQFPFLMSNFFFSVVRPLQMDVCKGISRRYLLVLKKTYGHLPEEDKRSFWAHVGTRFETLFNRWACGKFLTSIEIEREFEREWFFFYGEIFCVVMW